MLTCEIQDLTLTITDAFDEEPSLEDIVCAVANSIDVDFVEMENEGAPVFLGNDYAEYQLRLLTDRGERIFGIGPKERYELISTSACHVKGVEP